MTATQEDARPRRGLIRLVVFIAAVCGITLVGLSVFQLSALGPTDEVCTFGNVGNVGKPVFPPVVPGARVAGYSEARLCTGAQSFEVQWSYAGSRITWYLFGFLALVLLARLLIAALRQGSFAPSVPERLRTLGMFLAIGGPVTAVLTGFSQEVLLSTMEAETGSVLAGFPWLRLIPDPDGNHDTFPWFVFLTGLAALTLARAMRLGVRMSEDLEGTV